MMTPAQFKENLEDGLIRLKRSHEICVTGYDRAALKDLAHVLRFWMDMAKEVNTHLLRNPLAKFNAYSVQRKFNNRVRPSNFIFVPLPKSVTVLPSSEPGEPVILDIINGPNLDGNTSFSVQFQPSMRGQAATIGNLLIIFDDNNSTDEIGPGVINKDYLTIEKVMFLSWLSRPAANLRFTDEAGQNKRFDLSREILIRRVANILGASHPEGADERDDPNNAAVRKLMEYKAGNLPLAYLSLLKIAQDILAIVH